MALLQVKLDDKDMEQLKIKAILQQTNVSELIRPLIKQFVISVSVSPIKQMRGK